MSDDLVFRIAVAWERQRQRVAAPTGLTPNDRSRYIADLRLAFEAGYSAAVADSVRRDRDEDDP